MMSAAENGSHPHRHPDDMVSVPAPALPSHATSPATLGLPTDPGALRSRRTGDTGRS